MSLRSTGCLLSSPWCSFLSQWWCSAFWASAQWHLCASGYIRMLLFNYQDHLFFQTTFFTHMPPFSLDPPLPLTSTNTPSHGAGSCQSIWETWAAVPAPSLCFLFNPGEIHIINATIHIFIQRPPLPNSKHFHHSQRKPTAISTYGVPVLSQQPPVCPVSMWICPLWASHRNRIMQYGTFCAYLLLWDLLL